MPERRALFVDLDGTVRNTKSGHVHPLKPWDQEIRPGVQERLAQFRAAGYAVVGVTNQGGVAFGFLSEVDVRAINRRLEQVLLPDVFDLILYCPFHPGGRIKAYRRESECRKPRPGMAFEARERLGIELSRSIMVGDMDVDEGFAANAGIPTFYWEHRFFAEDFDADALLSG
ncbi:MAG: HAD-IIIA family hydrolase [Chloroflexi bacterium]|nr:HAD-IIIA family hydrolase [Chloroflexota bacterium]